MTCEFRSLGPAGELERIMALVDATQQVTVDDPTVVNDVAQDPRGVLADLVSRHVWFRFNGATPEVLHMVKCPGDTWSTTRWVQITAAGQPAPRPEDFLPALRDSVSRRVPTPIPRVAPADGLPEGWAFVQMDTYYWVDQAPGQWATVSATASVPTLSVTVQAVPERLIVTPGDGGGPVVCEGPQPVIDNATYVAGMPGCTYVYRDSSSTAADGATFPLRVAIEWHVTWSASNGQGGDLGGLRTDSAVRDLPVAEIQAVLTD